MWNSFFIFFLIINVIGAQSKEDPIPMDLRWQEINGASGYQIEIRDSNQKYILNEKIKKNFFKVTGLSSGKYEHRIGVINKLEKIEGFTDWAPFEVIVSKIPNLSRDKVFSASKKDRNKTIILEGNDFIEPLQVFLRRDEETIRPKSIQLESSNRAVAMFDFNDSHTTGVYDIIIENPRNKRLTSKQRFVLSDTPEKARRFAERQEKILKKEIDEDYFETPYWSTFWRSALLPGWGQKYIDGQNWKFWIYPVLAGGAGAAYYSSYQRFRKARSDYNEAIQFGSFLSEDPSLTLFWFFNQNNANASFVSAQREMNNIEAGVGFLGAFAIFNIIDSYMAARRNVAFHLHIFEERTIIKCSPRVHWDSGFDFQLDHRF